LSSAHLHPEFGCFCLSPKLRRRMCVVAAFLAFGSIAGASSLLSLMGDGRDADAARMVAQAEDAQATAPVPAKDGKPAVETTVVAKTVTAGPVAVTPAAIKPEVKPEAPKPEAGQSAAILPGGLKPACEETTWSYLDGKCISGNAHKPRVVRVPANRPAVAAVAPGRTAAPPARAGGSAGSAGSVAADNRTAVPSRPPLAVPISAPVTAAAAATGPVQQSAATSNRPQVAQVRADSARAPLVASSYPPGPFDLLFSLFRRGGPPAAF
jgi:hypothetical protein